MRTIKTTVYSFDELDEKGQEAAINNMACVNIHDEWWDHIYTDAENVGCQITGFDTGRSSSIDFNCDYMFETIEKILKEHGDQCDTYLLAKQFYDKKAGLKLIFDIGFLFLRVPDPDDLYDNYDMYLDDIKREFTQLLGEEYLSMLRKEYEYMTSEEAIKESIEANEYEFYENGKLL